VNAVLRFVDAVNRGDVAGVEAAFHPGFEMGPSDVSGV
jgi:hypothetical protein